MPKREDANYWHLQGLIGGDTRWRRHIKEVGAWRVRDEKDVEAERHEQVEDRALSDGGT
jgi:hypothetical protein